ncbi:radical SAM protein [Streptomyces sp. NPDC019890]|uniref:radical SAM protein n=1 Tax=Streptomyces sp. NPDC019890 TaxID=3365064 RepID=UPI00384A583C
MSALDSTPSALSSLRTPFKTALVSTAGHCATACGFCFRADRAHGFLEIPTFTRALSRLKEIGVEGICLTGGEPVHHPQLRDLVRLAHQFGIAISMVTSARTLTEVTDLEKISHLLSNITVSADSAGAMELGRTARSITTGIATLKAISTPVKVLHVTYWQFTDDECRTMYEEILDADVEVQFSPVALDRTSQQRAGLTTWDYIHQQRHDAQQLNKYVQLSPRFQHHLAVLRDMQLHPKNEPCRSSALYVSASGQIRRCPYGTAGVSVQEPRCSIRDYLSAEPQDSVTPECAAICRPDRA